MLQTNPKFVRKVIRKKLKEVLKFKNCGPKRILINWPLFWVSTNYTGKVLLAKCCTCVRGKNAQSSTDKIFD